MRPPSVLGKFVMASTHQAYIVFSSGPNRVFVGFPGSRKPAWLELYRNVANETTLDLNLGSVPLKTVIWMSPATSTCEVWRRIQPHSSLGGRVNKQRKLPGNVSRLLLSLHKRTQHGLYLGPFNHSVCAAPICFPWPPSCFMHR